MLDPVVLDFSVEGTSFGVQPLFSSVPLDANPYLLLASFPPKISPLPLSSRLLQELDLPCYPFLPAAFGLFLKPTFSPLSRFYPVTSHTLDR